MACRSLRGGSRRRNFFLNLSCRLDLKLELELNLSLSFRFGVGEQQWLYLSGEKAD
jgi:hypothetical protein